MLTSEPSLRCAGIKSVNDTSRAAAEDKSNRPGSKLGTEFMCRADRPQPLAPCVRSPDFNGTRIIGAKTLVRESLACTWLWASRGT